MNSPCTHWVIDPLPPVCTIFSRWGSLIGLDLTLSSTRLNRWFIWAVLPWLGVWKQSFHLGKLWLSLLDCWTELCWRKRDVIVSKQSSVSIFAHMSRRPLGLMPILLFWGRGAIVTVTSSTLLRGGGRSKRLLTIAWRQRCWTWRGWLKGRLTILQSWRMRLPSSGWGRSASVEEQLGWL